MPEKTELTVQTYLNAMHRYSVKVQGGTIHQFLKKSKVKYYGGACPIYQIEMEMDGVRVVIGGNFATNGRPLLFPCEPLDYA